ncbi:aldo/keto reductase family oxidoreductase [Pseudomonas sp. SMV71]|uniref:aldo/keto reductase family oxidoreductase n=1 Tax=Pseudomonas sp. SMV71 TaxID=3390195 RepID=UPI003F83F63F
MNIASKAGQFSLGDRAVNRMGYGAMQLAGPQVFGPPKDPAAAIAVLREALESGVNHIDTADFYGPHVTNQLIREALHPYAEDLVIVTKVGAVRGADASWNPAHSPAELTRAVHDNLRNLRLEVLDVVNLRVWGDMHAPAEESIEESFTTLADLQRQGLIRHLGLSNVTATQVKQAQGIAKVACVQNHYNLTHRSDEQLIAELGRQGIPYVPFFPLGGFSPLQSQTLSSVASRLGASTLCVALAWLLQRAPNILLIPGTSSVAHLRENLTAGELEITPQMLAELDGLA